MSENPLHILKNEWLEPVYARESFFKKLAKRNFKSGTIN